MPVDVLKTDGEEKRRGIIKRRWDGKYIDI